MASTQPVNPVNTGNNGGSVTTKYTFEEILQLRPSAAELSKPVVGLLYIVVTANEKPNNQRNATRNRRGATRNNRDTKNTVVSAVAPVRLQESENSFTAARKKREQDESLVIIGEIRQLLNKVTDDNMNVLLAETKNVYCPKINALMDTFETDEQQEAFLTQLAKLFVQKAQIDHAFSKWYAQIASEMVLPEFGDILYEVCRDALPALRYDPDQKHKYLGALLLLVELCRFKLIESNYLEAAADRIFLAIERNMGNVVMATTTEAPIDPAAQIEVCIDLLCKYLVAFFTLEKPVKVVYDRYMNQLVQLSQNKDRVKARSRFMLGDFFKAMKV
jgi:hypothetical protein